MGKFVEILLNKEFKLYESSFIDLINKKALICYKNTDKEFYDREENGCEHLITEERKPTAAEISNGIYHKGDIVKESFYRNKYADMGFDIHFCTTCNSDYFKEIDIDVKIITEDEFKIIERKDIKYYCGINSTEMYGSGYYDDFMYVPLCSEEYLDKENTRKLFSMCWEKSNDAVEVMLEKDMNVKSIYFSDDKIYLEVY